MASPNSPVSLPSQIRTLASRNSGSTSMKYHLTLAKVFAAMFDSRGHRSGGIST
jgi:hypothetical protein